MNFVIIHETIEIGGLKYTLHGCVRNNDSHFTVAVRKSVSQWFYIDDLCHYSIAYASFSEMKINLSDGWFFLCYMLNNVDSI